MKVTASGKPVANLALAYSVGYGENKRTQWLDGTLWGDRAEKLAPHLKKGGKVLIYGDDVMVETFPKNDGTQGVKLKCRIVDIEFAGDAKQNQSAPPQSTQQQNFPSPQQSRPTQQGQGFQGFNDMDESPF